MNVLSVAGQATVEVGIAKKGVNGTGAGIKVSGDISPLFHEGISAGWGDKACQQVYLASSGVPILNGFALSAKLLEQIASSATWLDPIRQKIAKKMQALEKICGNSFETPQSVGMPLLLCLRLDYPTAFTQNNNEIRQPSDNVLLNVGLTPQLVQQWLKDGSSKACQVWDALRRQAITWGCLTAEAPVAFKDAIDKLQQETLEGQGVEHEAELSAPAMQALAQQVQALSKEYQIVPLHELAAWEQLRVVLTALYQLGQQNAMQLGREREEQSILVQEMAQGFTNDGGSGRLQSRIPLTGAVGWHGAFMQCAQAEDLLLGWRIPAKASFFRQAFPQAMQSLEKLLPKLEKQIKDVLQVHFVVEAGTLRILSIKAASRSGDASLKIALDLSPVLSQQETMALIIPEFIRKHLYFKLDVSKDQPLFCKGLPASSGCAVGQLCLFAEDAEKLTSQGKKVILVRHETTPEDIDGLKCSEGVLTSGGGYTSHAALVARGMGKCAVVGVNSLEVDYLLNEIRYQGVVMKQGDWISMNGETGEVYPGQLPTLPPTISDDVHTVLKLADKTRTLKVRANADNKEDAIRAVKNGAEGIGLCRTEHMFFDLARITNFRKMILSDTEAECKEALATLLPLQRSDFVEIFEVMQERPVTIRLLDPPLHEFLPKGKRSRSRMAKAMGISIEDIQRRVHVMAEQNPMMGRRGCRLAFTHPSIYQMQTQAIVEAVCLMHKKGVNVKAEIMIPLVSDVNELSILREKITALINNIAQTTNKKLEIAIGAMVETPRAAICADRLAHYADFLSFGTNDLTQMTYGISRDDTGNFLPEYLSQGVFKHNPFVILDSIGVGELLQIAVQKARKSKPNIKLGICGEHGGEAYSVQKFHDLGLDYISCSPFRLLEARLAAGRSAAKIRKPC